MSEKKYLKEEIINFRESDWDFRRSSGYAGYDHKNHPGDEQKWIYQEDFIRRKQLKEQYEYESKLLRDFRTQQLPFGQVPDFHINDFLDKKFFKEE